MVFRIKLNWLEVRVWTNLSYRWFTDC